MNLGMGILVTFIGGVFWGFSGVAGNISLNIQE